MNFQSKNKSIVVGLFMVVVALTTLIASSFMMLREQDSVNQSMKMETNFAISQLNEKLHYVQNVMDMLASSIETNYTKYEELEDKETRYALYADVKKQATYALRAEELCYAAYFRTALELAGNGKEGFFCGYDDNGEIHDFAITVITRYDAQDIEHVGWYYIPVNYGHAVWMEPYYNANKEVCMISYVVPVYVENQLIGVLGMDIDIDDLSAYVKRMEGDQKCIISLTDRSDNAIPGMPSITNSGKYVECSGTLINEMKLTLYEEIHSVYVIRYHLAYYLLIGINLLLMVLGIVYLIVTQRRDSNEVVEKQKFQLIPTILAGAGVVTIFGLILFYQIASGAFSNQNQKGMLKPNNVYSETITVVADEKYAPYSYYDENGNPNGYDVAYIYEVANQMGYNVDLQLMSWSACVDAMKNGEADIVLGLEAGNGKRDSFLRSDAVSTDSVYIYGLKEISSVAEVLGTKIATIENNDLMDAYGVLLFVDTYASYEDTFHALLIGKADYVVAHRAVAQSIIQDDEYAKVKEVYNLMQCSTCYGVKEGNDELLAQLNRAIEGIKKVGTDSTLKERFLSEKNKQNFFEQYGVLFYMALAVIALLFISSILVYLVTRNNRRLRRLSEIDALTGINNRGGGERKIRALLKQKIPGMFCLMDIDKFKSINDTYGHGVGDQVLVAVADCLQVAFRDRDIVMRLGGDEFAVYVPKVCDKETGTKVIERFFEELHMLHIEDLEGHEVNVSLGATFYYGDAEDDFASIYLRADKGTYISKKMLGNTYHFEMEE